MHFSRAADRPYATLPVILAVQRSCSWSIRRPATLSAGGLIVPSGASGGGTWPPLAYIGVGYLFVVAVGLAIFAIRVERRLGNRPTALLLLACGSLRGISLQGDRQRQGRNHGDRRKATGWRSAPSPPGLRSAAPKRTRRRSIGVIVTTRGFARPCQCSPPNVALGRRGDRRPAGSSAPHPGRRRLAWSAVLRRSGAWRSPGRWRWRRPAPPLEPARVELTIRGVVPGREGARSGD